jgi:WD40 repeat protein
VFAVGAELEVFDLVGALPRDPIDHRRLLIAAPRHEGRVLAVGAEEQATGALPFPGKDVMSVLVALSSREPDPPRELNPDVPAPLGALILRLLAKDPAGRPASAREVAQALAEAAPRASDKPEAPARQSPRWRFGLVPICVAVLLLAVLGAAAYPFGPTVVRIATNKGELVIEADDKDVEVTVKHPDGRAEVHVIDHHQQREWLLQPGDYEIEVKEKDGLQFATMKLTLRRGDREVLRAELVLAQPEHPAGPPKPEPPAGPVLPEEAPVEAVLGDGRWMHWNWVNAVAVSPDGKWIASAGNDFLATVWDAATGRERHTLRGHQLWLCCVAFHPDGKRLATASWDATVRLWDVERGETLFVCPLENGVHSVAFSPDGTVLVGMTERMLWFWDAATGKELLTVPVDNKAAGDIACGFAFSPDGKRVAFRMGDDRVQVCDTATGKEPRLLPGHGKTVGCVAWSPDGKVLATATTRPDAVIALLDAETGNERHRFVNPQPAEDVRWLAFSPDSRTLAAAFAVRDWVHGKFSGRVRQWDVATGAERPPVLRTQPAQGFASPVFTPDSKTLITGDQERQVRFWDAASGQERAAPGGVPGHLISLALSPDGKTVAAGGTDETIRLFDLATRQQRPRFQPHHKGAYAVAFSPDGATLASAGDGTVRLWDLVSGEERMRIPHATNRLAFRLDGKVLAAPSPWNARAGIKLWGSLTDHEVLQLDDSRGAASVCLAFSPDSKVLATGYRERPVVLWDLDTGKEKWQLTPPDGKSPGALDLVFSPDGKTLAAAHRGPGESACRVRLWDVETGQLRLALPDYAAEVSSLAFRPDGKTLATVGFLDGTARLWDTATGRPQRTFVLGAPNVFLWKVVFTPDGRRLLTLNGNGTVSILRLTPP